MIIPCVFYSPNQRYLFDRLIQHCKDLDGTEVQSVHAPEPNVGYPAVCNVAFREVCKTMQGKSFVWLEADSIPVKKGWLKALEKEWKIAQSFGKSIMWSSDSNMPHDRCTGIGVYGPDALDLVPDGLSHDGFDGYILTHHSDKIHKTPLIQHSYGTYDAKGHVTLHRQPAVRNDAVIFHKDQFQDLIAVEKHFGHSGDLGDIIYALPLIQSQGGGYLWLFDRPFTKKISTRFDLIAPLLMEQPYIKATALSNGKDVQYDLSPFRSHYRPDNTLLSAHCAYARQKWGMTPVRGEKAWLTAKPDSRSKGRVVIARSPRYNTGYFPWKRIVEHYGDACLFIGLKEEHATFTSKFGAVECLPTKDLLEVSQVIAGSDLFVGNQSSPYALAEGLKHPRILESVDWCPDCIYPNPGIVSYDGHIDILPAAGGKPEEHFERKPRFRKMDVLISPPKGWRYPDLSAHSHIEVVASTLRKRDGIKKEDALELIYAHNCALNPEFFRDTSHDTLFEKVHRALRNIQ